MNAIVNVMLSNAVVVAALFAVLTFLRRWIRNPAVFHGLAVLLLVKLLVPWGWQPTLSVLPRADVQIVDARTAPEESSPASERADLQIQAAGQPDVRFEPVETGIVEAPATAPVLPVASNSPDSAERNVDRVTETPQRSFRPAVLIGLAWLVGTTVWLLIAVRRIVMFRKSLRLASPAPAELQELAATLARRLSLKRSPQIVIVPGQLPPMLWSLGGSSRIILSADLLDRLDNDERRSLLLHELAHYRRGDHWVRLVELAATGIYWWYPVLWWLRRELRLAEEQCCDAWVVETLPDQRRAYAEALVKTAGWLSGPALVPGTTGIGSTHGIEKRITRIMQDSRAARVSRRLKAVMAILAVGLLSCAPMVGPSSADSTEAAAAGDENAGEPVETMTGRIVTPEGQPVSEMRVEAFVNGEPWDTRFVTDEQGAIEVPAGWRFDERTRNQVVLVARDGDERLGWYAFRPGEPQAPAPFAFQLVLFPRDRVMQGRFVDEGGDPVADVRVVVNSIFQERNGHVGDYLLDQDVWLPSAPSDPSGRFSISMPANSRFRLRVDHPDWVRMEIPADETMDDLGRLTLYPAGRIEGRAVNANTGEPMAGHTIFVQALNTGNLREGFPNFAAAKVDEEGRYVIGGLPPAPFNVLHSSPREQRQWTAPAHEHVDVVVGQRTTVDFRVIRGQRLGGLVTEYPTGKPLAHISVGYYGAARPDSGAACMMVRTQDDGSYEFFVPPGASRVYVAEGNRGRAPDSSRTVMVTAGRPLGAVDLTTGPRNTGTFGDASTTAEAGATREPGAEPQRRPFEASLRLVPPDGMAVTKVDVRTVFPGARRTSMWSGLSGESSGVRLPGSFDGREVFFLIEARGFQPLRSPEFTVAEEMPELVLELQPEVRVPIRGRAVDGNGGPVADARVRIRRNLYGREMQFPWGLEYTTNDRGEFEIEHVRVSDRVQIRIDREGVGTVVTDWIDPADAEPIALGDVVVAPPDQVVGGVVRDYDGFPVPDARVSLLENPDVTTETDAEGAFRLVGAPMGEVELTILSPGFPADTRKATAGVLNNEIHVNRISDRDREDYQVDVHLETSDGKSPTHVTLYWCETQGGHRMTMPNRSGNDHTIGFVRSVRRSEGRPFVVIVTADGYAVSQPAVVPNRRTPEPVTIEMTAAPAVTLRGRVLDADGMPVAGARVGTSLKLTEDQNDESWHYFSSTSDLPQTDGEGRFQIDELYAGSQMAVYVNKEGHAGVWSERVTLTDAVTTLPDLVLPEGTAVIAGRVVDETGTPVEGAVVTLLDLGPVRTTTDAEGRFRFPNIGEKEYPVRASGEAGEWYDRVEAGTLDVEARLSRGR